MSRAIGYLVLALALSGACTKASSTNDEPGVGPRPVAATKISLTSVALADDCGGKPPAHPPVKTATAAASEPSSMAAELPRDESAAGKMQARRCEQTSMQLSITAGSDADVRVKSVEVLDERGTLLGSLVPSRPTRWSDAQVAYQTWDGKVVAGETALVSYVLSQPSFIADGEERDRTYTVKVVASAGGVDQALQTTVMVVAFPAAAAT